MWETRPGNGRQNVFPYALILWLFRWEDWFLFPLLRISHQKMSLYSSILPSYTSPLFLLMPTGWKHCSLRSESIPRALNPHITLAGSGGADRIWGKAWCFVQASSYFFISRGAERVCGARWVPQWHWNSFHKALFAHGQCCETRHSLGATGNNLQSASSPAEVSLSERGISHLCPLRFCLNCQKSLLQ